MNFKSKASLSLSAAALLFLSACGDDSSNKSVDTNIDELPVADSVQVSDNPTPSDSVNTPADSASTPNDSIPAVDDSATTEPSGSKIVMPPEATDIVPAVTIPKEEGKGLLIDDFEDGDNASLQGEFYWYDYNDNNGGDDGDGASEIRSPIGPDGYSIARKSDNGTNYAWAVYYALDKGQYKYDPYVGWGVTLDGTVDYTKYGGLTYWYKGGAHTVRVETSDVTNYDVHMMSMKASRTWTKAVIRFKDLAQEGWGGVEVEFDPAHITNISFQAKGNGKIDSLLIDNVYLQDTSEVEKDVADMEIKDPVIPEVKIGNIAISNPLQAKAMKYLNKGINITNWLEEDGTVFDGTFKFDEDDVKLMAENGIKSLRLPIDIDQYATNRDAFVADTTGKVALTFDDDNLFGVLDAFDEWTAKYGMSFVIDYHEYDNGYNTKTAINAKYTKMMAEVWKHVAAHYASSEREDLFFELLNEPDMANGKVSSANWRKAAQEIIDSIRTVDKKHSLIFGDAEWYSIKLLAKGKTLNDDNIIYAIHTYEPFVFTHQSANWTDLKSVKNLMFPYDKEKWSEYSADFGVTKSLPKWYKDAILNYNEIANKEYILNLILPAKEWAVTNNVPVIINEFGAYNLKTDKQSVLNYMTAMREISDTLEIPLTHWGYTGGFSLFESAADGVKGSKLIEGMAEAFGLEK